MSSVSTFAAIILIASSTFGCAARIRSAVRDAPHEIVPGVADESLKVLENEKTRKRIAEISGTPEMQDAFHDVAEAFVEGGVDALAADETNARLKAAIERLVGSLDALIEKSVRELTTTGTRALVQALSDPEVKKALRQLTDELSGGAIQGVKQAILDIRREQQGSGAGLIERAELAMSVSLIGAFLMGGVSVALLLWSLGLRRRARLYRAKLESSDKPPRPRPRPPTLTNAHAR